MHGCKQPRKHQSTCSVRVSPTLSPWLVLSGTTNVVWNESTHIRIHLCVHLYLYTRTGTGQDHGVDQVPLRRCIRPGQLGILGQGGTVVVVQEVPWYSTVIDQDALNSVIGFHIHGQTQQQPPVFGGWLSDAFFVSGLEPLKGTKEQRNTIAPRKLYQPSFVPGWDRSEKDSLFSF